jgi:hypothetical protein
LITVIVDTTATFVDVMMKKTNWMQLLTLCHNSSVQLIIPDVVLRETARHWEAEAAKAIEIANGKIGGIKSSRDRLTDLGVDGSTLVDSSPVTATPDQVQFLAAQKEKLVSLGVQIKGVPAQVDVETILQRDLARKKPFEPSGKGFRDALVWETIKNVALDSGTGDQIFFVTDNAKDYCDSAGGLAVELLTELEGAVADLHRVGDLDELLAHEVFAPKVAGIAKTDEQLATFLAEAVAVDYDDGPPTVGDVVKKAVINALEALSGEDVDMDGQSWGTDFSGLSLPGELEGLSIDVIEADESTLTWQTYETYDDTTFLIQAEVWAQISLVGFAYKSDAIHLEAEQKVYVLDWDWNDHMAHVATSTNAKLTFQVQVEHGMSHAEDCQLESVTSLPNDEDHP